MKLPHWLLSLLGCFLTTAARGDDWITYPAKGDSTKSKHLVFLTGDEEYRSEEGLPMLARILSQRHGFKCTVLFAVDKDGKINPNNNASLSGASGKASCVNVMIHPNVYSSGTKNQTMHK